MIHRLSFETGHYSRTWEISTAHLTEEALRYLERRVGDFDSRPTGLMFEPFALTDCNGVGCKLIGTPWTDDDLLNIESQPYSSLRQEQLDAGTPEALVNVLYLAALADVRLLIFLPPTLSSWMGSPFLMNSNAFSVNTTRLESTFSLNRSFTSCQVLH